MPTYRLLADYDHDGSLDESPGEYALHDTWPGAVVVANVDADSRGPLPTRFAVGNPAHLDFARYGREPTDDERVPLLLLVDPPPATDTEVRLRVTPEALTPRITFYGPDRRILPASPHPPRDRTFTIPAGTARVPLWLEARTVPGSPFPRGLTLPLTYRGELLSESRFRVEVLEVGGDGASGALVAHGRFTLTPLLFLHAGLTARRIYLQSFEWVNGSGNPGFELNGPTRVELAAAVTGIRDLELILVPTFSPVEQDAWLQDQFAAGATVGPSRARTTILHLPRLRVDAGLQTSEVNLARFVRSHFAAQDVGLVNDFWERQLTLPLDTGGVQTMSPQAYYFALFASMAWLPDALGRYVQLTANLRNGGAGSAGTAGVDLGDTWSSYRRAAPDVRSAFEEALRDARANAGDDATRAMMDSYASMASADFERIDRSFPMRGDRFGLPPVGAAAPGRSTLDASQLDRLFERLVQLGSSSNYGGNILASPPMASAPLGKLVAGNAEVRSPPAAPTGLAAELADPRGVQPPERLRAWDAGMDPDLVRFLDAGPQPFVSVDLRWLSVGHVDEVLTFVPDRRRREGEFVILRASPSLAMRILGAASERYHQGRGAAAPDRYVPGASGRQLMDQGSTPVTRLFRGKLWTQRTVQIGPPGSPFTKRKLPPVCYQRLARAYGSAAAGSDLGFEEIPDRGYRLHPADITVDELLYCDGETREDGSIEEAESTNRRLEVFHMRRIVDILRGEFGNVRIGALPVVFDHIADFESGTHGADAFVPNIVNMQVVNGHLLVPKPYGPRMRLADATQVMWDVLSPSDAPNPDLAAARDMIDRIGDPDDASHRDGIAGDLAPNSLLRELTPSAIRRAGLTESITWIAPIGPGATQANSPPVTMTRLAQWFSDSYPNVAEAEVAERIFRAIRRGRQPLAGWLRLRLAEETVDLFELYTFMVAASLGLRVTFVDCWYYHERSGELHCGSNVLREVDASLTAALWRALA